MVRSPCCLGGMIAMPAPHRKGGVRHDPGRGWTIGQNPGIPVTNQPDRARKPARDDAVSEDQRVTDLLLWIEPQPIRGRHDEFFQHAVFLAEALLLQREAGMRFSLFSNRAVLTRLARDCPAVRPALRHPTEWETRALDAHAGPWTEARLRVWLDLVDGRGAAADLHRDIAARLIAERRPDAVLMWSDNGA